MERYGIGLFEFHSDAIFVIYRFCLTVFGVLLSPRLCCGSCQMGYMVPYKLRASNLKHKDSCFHRLQTLLVAGNIFRQLDLRFLILLFVERSLSDNFMYFFPYWLTRSVFLDVLRLFYILRCRNRAVSNSVSYHFCGILILFSSFWGPVEATFLTWILSSGLSGAHNVRAWSLRHI